MFTRIATRWCCSQLKYLKSPHINSTGNATVILRIPAVASVPKRFYPNFKRTVRIPPTKPLSFDYYSRDNDTELSFLNSTEPRSEFKDIPEYDKADEFTKKILSLEFAPRRHVVDRLVSDVVEKVQEHPSDLRSREVQIAKQTILIRNQIRHCLRYRKDKVSKSLLIRRIQKRHQMLKVLQRQDIDKFEWLTKELNLTYTPVPEYNRKLSRRATRKKIARDAAIVVKKEKISALKQRFTSEWAEFEKQKEDEMRKIEREMQELGVEMQPTFAETLTALGQKDLIPKTNTYREKMRAKRQKKLDQLMEHKALKDTEILKKYNFLSTVPQKIFKNYRP